MGWFGAIFRTTFSVSIPWWPCLLLIVQEVEGTQQWAFKAAASALEVIPRTLAQNCGANVVRVLTQLRVSWRLPLLVVILLLHPCHLAYSYLVVPLCAWSCFWRGYKGSPVLRILVTGVLASSGVVINHRWVGLLKDALFVAWNAYRLQWLVYVWSRIFNNLDNAVFISVRCVQKDLNENALFPFFTAFPLWNLVMDSCIWFFILKPVDKITHKKPQGTPTYVGEGSRD